MERTYKGNEKSSAQYFTSNDVLLKLFQGHLKVMCYTVFGALRKFGDPNAQIKVRKSYIESHCRSLTQLLILNETGVRPSEGQLIIPVLVCLGIGASQGKTPSTGHRYAEIHP